jgi:hypothetical protein
VEEEGLVQRMQCAALEQVIIIIQSWMMMILSLDYHDLVLQEDAWSWEEEL